MTVSHIDDAKYEFATNCFGFASYIVLVWDHIITFDDEVKFIWRARRKTFISWLFLLNRYIVGLGFILNLFAYLSPLLQDERCQHFVRFEGALTCIGLSVAGLMMMVRVTAIYTGNRLVSGFLLLMWVVQLAVNAWLLTAGIAVTHSAGVRGCTMIFDDKKVGNWAAASAWLPLLYDTVVFGLIAYKTCFVQSRMSRAKLTHGFYISRTLLVDGLLYYGMIFAANLVLIIMILSAPDGLKNISAQFELLITVTMMSRITLSLKKHFQMDEDAWLDKPTVSTLAHWTFSAGSGRKRGPSNAALLHQRTDSFTLDDVGDITFHSDHIELGNMKPEKTTIMTRHSVQDYIDTHNAQDVIHKTGPK